MNKIPAITEIKNRHQSYIRESIHEAAISVLPLVLSVFILSLFFLPLSTDLLVSFLIGTILVIAGIGLFELGASRSMTPLGSTIGTALTKTGNLILILIISFLLGFAITAAEPDLQVLAGNIPYINSNVLIYSVSAGVGFFMMLCMLRILCGWKLRTVLLLTYIPVFLLAFTAEKNILPVAFDAGGVTTGPMTVPFILALGMGISNIRSDKNAEADSFGLVGLSSAGPVLVVLILGLFCHTEEHTAPVTVNTYATTTEITKAYLQSFPIYLKEMFIALLPIIALLFIFQISLIHMEKEDLLQIIIGLFYTYTGLVLFMTGVNVGFSSMGRVIGAAIAAGNHSWLLIPAAMLLGRNAISAEPAVAVLEKQIQDVSAGTIPPGAIQKALRIAVMTALGCASIRVLSGTSLLCFIVPGYILAFALSFFIPDIYTSIAFDSGGVASGPLTASFLLPLLMGASSVLGGNPYTDAFGTVSLVALFPIISIEIVGLLYSRKQTAEDYTSYSDYDIIDLFEEES